MQPLVHWASGLSGGQSGQAVKFTTDLYPVPRLRMSRNTSFTPSVCLHGIYRDLTWIMGFCDRGYKHSGYIKTEFLDQLNK